jgi:hypothetical protein
VQHPIDAPAEEGAGGEDDDPGGEDPPGHPQRTAERRFVAPTPRIADEMTCVVETGIPSRLDTSITVAAAAAAKPWIGRSSTTFSPIVRTIRQPPIAVPSAIAVAAPAITQNGTCHWLPVQP